MGRFSGLGDIFSGLKGAGAGAKPGNLAINRVDNAAAKVGPGAGKPAGKVDNAGSSKWSTVDSTLAVGGLAGAVLAPLLIMSNTSKDTVDKTTDSLFPFLPDNMREVALAFVSCCSCACVCCVCCILMIYAFSSGSAPANKV